MGIYDRPYYSEGADQFSWRPAQTWSAINAIMIANVLVFVADMIYTPSEGSYYLNQLLGLYDADLFHPSRWIRFLTYGFTHASIRENILHIVMNMFVLWMFGRFVEAQLGKTRFLVMYLASIVLCGVLTLVWHSIWGITNQWMVGASGAVSTVLVYYVFLAPNSQVYFFFFPMPAWVMGLIIIGMDFVRSFSGNDHVAHETHLIGAALGATFFQFGVPGWNWVSKLQKWWRKRQLKVVRAEESRHEHLANEADKILDKVNKTGYDSLTASEKKILEKYSRNLRSKN